MSAEKEKAPQDLESQTRSTSSSGTLPVHNAVHSEKPSIERRRSFGSQSDDSHEQVEAMDLGHQHDLQISRTHGSLRSSAAPGELRRQKTGGSLMSRVLTRVSTTKERVPPIRIPEQHLEDKVVGWESQDDPTMPLNFPQGKKMMILGLISSITFISPLASSMFAPGVSFMMTEFHNENELLAALSVSVFVLGYAFGPLFLSPLSEIYGRRFVLTAANAFFVLWQIGCALAPNIETLIICRFFAGVGGSGCITIGGGVIADLFQPDQRGFASSVFALGPLFGPVVGPICGGFIAQRAGWRWVFWTLLIASGVVSAAIEFFNMETNHRVLILRKTKKLRIAMNEPELRSCYEETHIIKPPTKVILHAVIRPIKLLFRSVITALMSVYMALVYGLLYLLFTTITSVFQKTYGWEPEITGLAYLGVGVGFFLGVAAVALISDRTVVKLTLANGGIFEPEMRLPACVVFACFIPSSFFWYGWTVYYEVHWICPIIALMPFGFGMMGVFIPVQTYIIDAFPEYAASAVAALTVSRSVLAATLPLAGPQMYRSLGYGWGNSLLGFVAFAMIPIPLGIMKWGKMIREKYPVNLS